MKSNSSWYVFIFLLCLILSFRAYVIHGDASKVIAQIDFVDEVIDFLDEQNLKVPSLKILSDDANRLRFYLNNESIDFLRPLDYGNPGFYLRENGTYVLIEDRIKNRDYDIIIILDSSNYSDSSFKKLLDVGYNRHNLQTISIFILNTEIN